MKKSLLFISCDEAHHICDKQQYGEATFWERIKLNLRLSWCRVTRAYTKKNRALTRAIEKADIHALDQREMADLKQRVQNDLRNQ